METTRRQSRTSLIEDLLERPYEFEFHQAIKLFEAASPHLLPLGEGSDPDMQPITLKSRALLAYPSSDIFTIQKNLADGSPPVMHVNFFGIAGAQGPLPMPYTEKLISRTAQKDFVMRDFLDIFNHRFLSILHKIKKKHNVSLVPEDPRKTVHAKILSHLMGLSKPSLKNRFSVSDDHFYGLSAFIWQKHRSIEGLKLFLENFFQVPVTIDQFQGKWMPIDPSEITRLGGFRLGRNQILSRTATLGTRYWDQQNSIKINLGPLTYKDFSRFLKTEPNYTLLCEVTRFYLQLTHSFHINLVLKKEEVPASTLGKSRLGWTSWVKTRPMLKDDHQVILKGDTP